MNDSFLLVRIEFKNFRYYEDITLDFNGPGLHYVTGLNGSGKSDLFLGIWWIIGGKTELNRPGRIVGPHDNQAWGRLTFDGPKPLIIERKRARNDHLQIIYDGKPLDEKGMSATWNQEALDRILGLEAQALRFAHLLPAASDQGDFLMASDEDRRKALTLLWSQQDLDRVYSKVDEQAKEAKRRCAAAEKAQTVTDAKVGEVEHQCDQLEKQLSELQTDTNEQGLRQKWEEAKKTEEEAKKILELLERESDKAHELYRNWYKRQQETLGEYRRREGDLRVARDRLQDMAERVVVLNDALKAGKASRCPTCQQELKGGSKRHLAEEKNRLLQEVGELRQEEERAQATVKALHNELEVAGRQTASAQAKGQQFVSKAKTKREECQRLEADRKALDIRLAPGRSPIGLKKLLSEAQERLQGLTMDAMMATVETDEASHQREIWQFWKDSYRRDIKIKLFASLAVRLSEALQRNLQIITSDDLEVRVDVQVSVSGTEKVDVVLRSDPSQHDWYSARGASGGEKRKTSLAMMLAQASLVNSPLKFRLLDEPLAHVDPESMIRAQRHIMADARSGVVLYITHEEQAQSLSGRFIRVIRKDNRSDVVQN